MTHCCRYLQTQETSCLVASASHITLALSLISFFFIILTMAIFLLSELLTISTLAFFNIKEGQSFLKCCELPQLKNFWTLSPSDHVDRSSGSYHIKILLLDQIQKHSLEIVTVCFFQGIFREFGICFCLPYN